MISGASNRDIDSAPLDWTAVTDHAEYIGEMYSTMNLGAPGYDQ